LLKDILEFINTTTVKLLNIYEEEVFNMVNVSKKMGIEGAEGLPDNLMITKDKKTRGDNPEAIHQYILNKVYWRQLSKVSEDLKNLLDEVGFSTCIENNPDRVTKFLDTMKVFMMNPLSGLKNRRKINELTSYTIMQINKFQQLVDGIRVDNLQGASNLPEGYYNPEKNNGGLSAKYLRKVMPKRNHTEFV
jgi:hypothetical protein